ncbi:cell envelope integrity protein TolA [Legionella waltersii]|uniref:TolA colicin import membrane protein n=1 Tax=Legionella waltersii TaxID=66969 RepID=A0A0W1A0Y8_9GAMM|nr:cell envelope integrity protein TolA [Legionella waltersii]KTD75031.1 TolA colicin import membrane protein [Legionella waltersii]SNV05456.1 TolA colicin import membrane protein [Legionella waltersii]
MIRTPNYRKAFISALMLHVFLIIILISDTSTSKPALTQEAKNTPGTLQPVAQNQEVVKAVSVDSKEVMDKVNQLKQQREQQKKAELARQRELQRQAEAAKQQRIKEQQEIAKLKEEANKIAIARKKEAEEEKKRLKELADQKQKEAKRIEELKKQSEELAKKRELEAKKLADLNKKRAEENAKAEKLKAEQARLAKEKADLASKKQAEAIAKQQAAENAERQAQIAGEVDKYKALILNAIGRNWILPENVNSNLECKFRIRLAPDGTVLDVSLTQSSGDPILDRSAQTAINKASPLPVPSDQEIFNNFRDISLTVRPEQVRG